jgi:hypothetical protein
MKSLFLYLEKWFLEHNWPPVRMALSGKNIPRSTQTRTFKHCKKLLEKNNYEAIDHFWIGATPLNHSSDMFDSVLSFNIRLYSTKASLDLYFHNDIIPPDLNYVQKMVLDLSRWVQFGYGISYKRDFARGPGLYADGMIYGTSRRDEPVDEQENTNISKWFHIYGDPEDYHHGDLRDIYPLNFLSKEHLERSIDGHNLKIWIESSPDHGTLKPLTNTIWSWHVPEDKISDVREALRHTGIILCI